MSEPLLHFVTCPDAQGQHRMAYWQWGDAQGAHVVLCVHGLTRQGRDFDTLAQALVGANPSLRVVCPDVVGRGQSEWLADPQGYQVPQYVGDMLALLTHLNGQAPIETLDWVGTSMGGLIGMATLGTPDLPLPVPVRRLVLNDVGPTIEWAAIQRIGQYLGKAGRFESEQQAADAMWAISSGFGPHTPAQWLALTKPLLRELPADQGGGFVLRYDPNIAVPFRAGTPETAAQGEVALWHAYDQITAPTLVLRGADSDLLSRDTTAAMAARGPKARVVEFAGVGHAPTLVAADQVQAVTDFLLAA